MARTRIVGTGIAVPPQTVSNAVVCGADPTTPQDIEALTGIRERHWAETGMASSDLAVQAAREALARSGYAATEVDAIIVSTTSPDTVFPSTACYVQHALGAKSIAAFDVAASCSGFLYGLSMADVFIRAGQYRTCLVIAAEVKSAFLDRADSTSRALFADGAGAALVRREDSQRPDGSGILGIRLYADGAGHDLIQVVAGGSRQPLDPGAIREQRHTIRLQGAPVFRLAVRRLAAGVGDLLKEFGLAVTDVRQVLFHQANGRILAALCERLTIPPDRTTSIIERYGNTSSASLPMVLHEAASTGKLKTGDLLLLGAFGGGLTWGTALIRW